MVRSRRRWCAASDKVNNFQLVISGELVGRPSGAGDDGAVVFDGNAVRAEAESLDEVDHG